MKGSRPLTPDETVNVLNNLSNVRDRLLFLMGTKTGFRISELLSISVGDIYSNGNVFDTVSIRRCNMKKKKEGRTVVLHSDVKQLIKSYINQNNLQPNDYLFKSKKGDNITRVQAWRILNSSFSSLNLQGKLGTHCMRKTFANKVYNALDRDLVATQKALGHANINSTVSYLSFSQDNINKAILET